MNSKNRDFKSCLSARSFKQSKVFFSIKNRNLEIVVFDLIEIVIFKSIRNSKRRNKGYLTSKYN